ncbi:MAG TPA: type II toxin-antitoxin system HicA family toxin [Ktedonobacterales bacterium]
MRLHTLEAQLARDGWLFLRQKGSHRHYRNARGQRITVNVHGGAHTPVCWRRVEQVRRDLAQLIDAKP